MSILMLPKSGQLSDDDGMTLVQQGFDGFLKKPFTVQGVIQAIENAVAA